MNGFIVAVIFIWSIAAWLTHIVYCLKASAYLLLIAGSIIVPVGVIHGTGLWFGWW